MSLPTPLSGSLPLKSITCVLSTKKSPTASSDAARQPQIAPKSPSPETLLTRSWSPAPQPAAQDTPQVPPAAPRNPSSTPKRSLTAVHQHPSDWRRVSQSGPRPGNPTSQGLGFRVTGQWLCSGTQPSRGQHALTSRRSSVRSIPDSAPMVTTPDPKPGYVKSFLNPHLITLQQHTNKSHLTSPSNFPKFSP